MTRIKSGAWTLVAIMAMGVLVCAAVFFGLSRASAQPPGQGPLPGIGGQGLPGGFMPRMPMMQPAAICAAGDFVYVLRGNTLYQFDARELKQVKKARLEEQPAMPPQGGIGGGPLPPPGEGGGMPGGGGRVPGRQPNQ